MATGAGQTSKSVTRVLVVEDNPGDADLVKIALDEGPARGEFAVEHVTSLSAAVARVSGPSPPHVVLLDLSLPDASGLDGLRRLTEAGGVPVVVHTGSEDRGIGRAAIQGGAQDYLLKGADAELVPRALRYAVERHELATRTRLLAEEHAARAQAEAARERMATLAAASEAVSHSLDCRHALTSLASSLVPRFAEWCAIRPCGSDGGQPEWIAVHGEAAAADALRSWLAERADGLLASGRAELCEDVRSASAPSWAAALAELGAASAMAVPARVTDEVVGILLLARAGAPGDAFELDDLALADEIGRRAGVAITNCRLYLEARLAVTAREEFLSIAAHELRTPVAVLQLRFQQAAAKQQASVCATCEHAVPADYAGAARQVSRLARLIEGLLDVSRLVGSRMTLEREELELDALVRDVIDRLRDVARQHRSEIALRSAAPVRGSWDRMAIDRVLVNLLSNSLKFGGEKPVEVRIRSEGGDAVIEVEDHGIGIQSADIGRIFGQFERAVSARHFGGLGLGLYVSRRFVEEHGGTISVASRAGAGSVFTVRLPRGPSVAEMVDGVN